MRLGRPVAVVLSLCTAARCASVGSRVVASEDHSSDEVLVQMTHEAIAPSVDNVSTRKLHLLRPY